MNKIILIPLTFIMITLFSFTANAADCFRFSSLHADNSIYPALYLNAMYGYGGDDDDGDGGDGDDDGD